MATYRLISLFTGAGGLDLGFEAAGFETAVAVEMDDHCVQTLRHNREWPIIKRDVHSVSSREVLKLADLEKGEADLLIGGPPCQPFSKSGFWATGDSKRLKDPRASTLDEYLRILEDSLPTAFLLENVAGLAYKGKAEGMEYLLRRIDDINQRQGTRYRVESMRVNAAHYGVPQIRERVLLVGNRDGKSFGYLTPTHGDIDSDPLLPRFTTVWDAIGHFPAPSSEELQLKGKWADLLPSIPEGQNYLFHTERGGGVPLFGWRRRFWNFLLKAAKDRPCWTLTAQPGPATGPFHWQNRHFSAEELAAIQTFPADYRIIGNRSIAQKQVGNAVPSALAELVGLRMRARYFGELEHEVTRPTLIPSRSERTPRRCPVRPVPKKYHDLIGTHSAHPGTGKGYGAMKSRAEQER